MLVQFHLLQSMPPGNLNRDETGQPKHCLFGGVTRGRISSQCLKRTMRRSEVFQDALGQDKAHRTVYLPKLVTDAIRRLTSDLNEAELEEIAKAIAGKFKAEKGEAPAPADDADQGTPRTERTGQLVFFPESFAQQFAEMILDLRTNHERVYQSFLGRKIKPALDKDEKKAEKAFPKAITAASKQSITPDIALFGRMTTSDLIVNVDASCQVAHALSTHETLLEGDYFTAMDDLKATMVESQVDQGGAAFLGAGDSVTWFNAAVYYKYLNVDVDSLSSTLPPETGKDVSGIVGALLEAAALATPTGKQNSFAAHGVPEYILVEFLPVKRPISYANAFLEPVEGGAGRNLMTASVKALHEYLTGTADAFIPEQTERLLLAVGNAAVDLPGAVRVKTLDALRRAVTERLARQNTSAG